MKMLTAYAILALSLLASLPSRSQAPPISFVLDKAAFRSVLPNFRDSAEKALQIEARILSSQEFKDSLLAHTFTCQNYPATKCNCGYNNTACTTRIAGSVVYKSLMQQRTVTMKLVVTKASIKARLAKSYGYSCPCKYTTTTYTWWLYGDDELSLTEYYAAHLAHEYTHIVGYLHGAQPLRDDAAYVVGDIVEHILLRRKNAKPSK
jgi:hypothetical protein